MQRFKSGIFKYKNKYVFKFIRFRYVDGMLIVPQNCLEDCIEVKIYVDPYDQREFFIFNNEKYFIYQFSELLVEGDVRPIVDCKNHYLGIAYIDKVVNRDMMKIDVIINHEYKTLILAPFEFEDIVYNSDGDKVLITEYVPR